MPCVRVCVCLTAYSVRLQPTGTPTPPLRLRGDQRESREPILTRKHAPHVTKTSTGHRARDDQRRRHGITRGARGSRRRARGGVAFLRRPSGSVHPAPEQGPDRDAPAAPSLPHLGPGSRGRVVVPCALALGIGCGPTGRGAGACSCPGAVYLGRVALPRAMDAHHRSCPRGCCAATARAQPNVVAAHRRSDVRAVGPRRLFARSLPNGAEIEAGYVGLCGPSERAGSRGAEGINAWSMRMGTGGGYRLSPPGALLLLQPHARWPVWEGAHSTHAAPAVAGFSGQGRLSL